MRSHARLLVPLMLASCSFDDGNGTQIGALKESTIPQPPSDLVLIDMVGAVQESFRIAGIGTLATAWAAHVASMERATEPCPITWLGPPPEDFVNIDGAGPEGLSWFDNCTTTQGTSFQGFSYWTNVLDPSLTSGAREIAMDGVITDASGNVLLDFDGEAADELRGGAYASTLVARVLTGSLVGSDKSLRGELEARWGNGGEVSLVGSIHIVEGFGPPDTRTADLEVSPELKNVTGWAPGIPRFTSVRYDLDFGGDCPLEPRGYVGVRGNEGFWFDVYFLPKYDPEEDSARSASFPYESIDNLACDGIGTVFVRNLDLRAVEAANPTWSREIQVGFAAIIDALPTPANEDFVFTLQHLPVTEEAP